VFGIGCDGYEKPISSLSLPKISSKTNELSDYRVLLAPSPSGGLQFDSEVEQRHFHKFQSETANEICGIFESIFWQKLVPQACHREKFVLDAVIALSAYSASLKLSQAGLQDELLLANAAEQAQFALRKYQNCLQVMQMSLSNAPSPQKALMACLLVCSFEGLLGNTVTALAHARSGQTLVENFLAEHPHPNPKFEGITSPATFIIEDKLLQAATYFETQIIGLFDGRSRDDHAMLKREGKETISRMPQAFKDLDEACIYWDLVSRRSMHFVCEYSTNFNNGLNPYAVDDTTGLDSQEKILSYAKSSSDKLFREQNMGDYQVERKKYLEDIAHWSAAFSDLYSRLKRTTNKRQIMGAHALNVKSKAMEMDVGSAMESGTCSHDKYFTHFREIVNLSREIIRIKKTFSQSDFAVELGIIPSLHATAKWCRERTIRREAIAILRWYDSREGHWDSNVMADIDTCVMELEEEGVDTEFIPECARVRVLSITSDDGEGWAIVEYIRGSLRTGELPRSKRIRCPGVSYTLSRRNSEESEESEKSTSSATSSREELLVLADLADVGQSGDELCKSSCTTP
jgi:hypothetical protein